MRTSTAPGLRACCCVLRGRHSGSAQTGARLRQIKADEKVVLFNCATGLKYPMPADPRRIDLGEAIDYDFILRLISSAPFSAAGGGETMSHQRLPEGGTPV